MYKKKSFFITFEGIEGSGKSYQSRKLFNNLLRMKLPAVLTREPGGTISAEKIRKVLLDDYFSKGKKETFDKYTDTLLYLAARNEHIKNKIKPSISKKKIIICDRFTDSTLAYQVYGKRIDKSFIDYIHKSILSGLKPKLTFILTVNLSKSFQRLKRRKKKNRYDKFTKNFYKKVQKGYVLIAKNKKKNSLVLNTSHDSKYIEKLIFSKFLELIRK